ncbi:invasion associated locus B family protein [Candidatus Pelagibacter bacterium]|nr:invasion associated locus B family protein [Candidatus Pelagibacter bacterium]|tara:strand:+ start:536 stop:1045 length:510 start_codon:yes stop_codon:yes gene_type:complete
MSIIKKLIFIILISTYYIGQINAEEIKKMGTHKDWETYIINTEKGKVCFAQSKPVLQAPPKNSREARLFISFRPGENIKNEISVTSGYEYNNKNSITAKSGKNKYKFDIIQESFAWITDNKFEKKMINTMKKGSRIMVTGYNQKGSQTIDHYSLLGFTKAYKATKANCS